jgi:NADH-quinone oxidoreductase subunit K
MNFTVLNVCEEFAHCPRITRITAIRSKLNMVPTHYYLLLSVALFTIGVIGVLTRRNIMIILMSIELMMNAVNINLIAFSGRLQHVTGQVFAIFVITVAAAEAAVGLGIVIAMFKNKETMNINEIDLMKW